MIISKNWLWYKGEKHNTYIASLEGGGESKNSKKSAYMVFRRPLRYLFVLNEIPMQKKHS